MKPAILYAAVIVQALTAVLVLSWLGQMVGAALMEGMPL